MTRSSSATPSPAPFTRRASRPTPARAPGDALVFTKRIGTGVISTALKRGIAREADVAASIASMLTLNRAACEEMLRYDVHGCTDVTGFGLIGHAREMALASQRDAGNRGRSACSSCPARWSTRAPAPCPAASRTIANSPPAPWRRSANSRAEIEDLLYDPQTSGGLLISMPESDAAKFTGGYRIGRVLPRAEKAIRLI